MYIDAHCHLDMLEKEGIDRVIDRAKKKNVKIVLTDGVNLKTNRKSLKLSEIYGEVKACLGIYPDEALKLSEDKIREEINIIRRNKEGVFGIGEVGLDFSGEKSEGDKRKQRMVFQEFIELSIELGVPITVHSRKAEEECIEMLEDSNAKKVVMHYFSGKLKLIDRIVENGWLLSVPTAVKNSEHFQNIIKKVDIKNLLCETDSPYSHPDKKFPNEPSNVIESYKQIAKIKNIDLKDCERKIQSNFEKIY